MKKRGKGLLLALATVFMALSCIRDDGVREDEEGLYDEERDL